MLGRLILETWNFPLEIVTAVAEHEELSTYRGDIEYVDVVLVANLHSYIGTTNRHAETEWIDVPAFARLELAPDKSIAVLESAKDEVAEVRKILSA